MDLRFSRNLFQQSTILGLSGAGAWVVVESDGSILAIAVGGAVLNQSVNRGSLVPAPSDSGVSLINLNAVETLFSKLFFAELTDEELHTCEIRACK